MRACATWPVLQPTFHVNTLLKLHVKLCHFMASIQVDDIVVLVLLCRYSATDHTKFDQSLKHCPLGAVCRNCMPINDTADTCWAVKSPILYKVKSWGKIETSHKSEQVRTP